MDTPTEVDRNAPVLTHFDVEVGAPRSVST